VLFIIGGKSNNTDIYETFRAMGDALRQHFSARGASPLYVVVGRGGPNLVRGMGALAGTLDSLGLPYRFFGFDSAISEVVNYSKRVDESASNGTLATSFLSSSSISTPPMWVSVIAGARNSVESLIAK
jgi:hypothetical protein